METLSQVTKVNKVIPDDWSEEVMIDFLAHLEKEAHKNKTAIYHCSSCGHREDYRCNIQAGDCASEVGKREKPVGWIPSIMKFNG